MTTQALLENFLQALVAGVLNGSLYGLMCVGLALIFGIMRVINFAQGEFLMLGMYLTLYIVTGLGLAIWVGPYAGPFVGAALAGLVLFVGGYLLHRYLVSRVTGIRAVGAEGEGHYAQLILTLGISLVLQNGGLILFGSTRNRCARRYHPRVGDRAALRRRAAIFVNQARTVASVIGRSDHRVVLVHRPSRLGKALRAAADNPEAATYMGIDVDRAHRTRSVSALASRLWPAAWWPLITRFSRTSVWSS
jgi:branched-chain amino acid transport system permease protein